jgi:hypothetical protein
MWKVRMSVNHGMNSDAGEMATGTEIEMSLNECDEINVSAKSNPSPQVLYDESSVPSFPLMTYKESQWGGDGRYGGSCIMKTSCPWGSTPLNGLAYPCHSG